MDYYISILIVSLILDFSILVLENRIFHLRIGKVEFFMLMLFSTMPGLIYIFSGLDFLYYFLIKLGFYIFVSIFITDSFEFKRIISLLLSSIFLLFSVYGFGEFFILFVRSIVLLTYGKDLYVLYNCLIIFALSAYIFILVIFFTKMAKRKKIKSLLSKVSFFLFGRHIEITGLIDSGNSLVDTKTKSPVIIIPLSVLKKYLSESECEMIERKQYFGLNISHELEYISVGGVKGKMPIAEIGEIELERNGEVQKCKCVLGIVEENFADSKNYDCLLSRDFL